ncbi:MAG: topoisomerase DNA-binding C4 zinc finger domain-containing protein [Candidatus Methanomethylophilaceae archaeon]|nr:topoisomerase DNA-binding C4 zinc finger domain-containing protein [Candidatus Methanomethylophilaceae archaeon]
MTIHGSKGLQANYVFSLNNKSGKYGFSSRREESPVISMLLGGEDTQLDEERRLFYVAMTRANRALYLLTYEGHESEFYRELFGGSGPIRDEIGFCPICGGALVLRKGRYGTFYGCSNYHTRGCKFKRQIEKQEVGNNP